ncbi:MAG: DUF3352 domain-containing protein [Planctomycetota bacterium]
MKSVVPRLAVAVLLAAFSLPRTSVPQSRTKPVPPERILPDRTLALLSVSDWSRTKERFKETALHDIWQEAAIKEFVRPITTKIDEVLDRLRAECREGLGMELDSLAVLFQGGVHIGVVGIRVQKKASAADVGDDPRVVRMLTRIATQERVFKAQVEVDQDGDGVGEYGLLGELAGELARRPKKKERIAPPYLGTACATGGSGGKGYASADGYLYRVLLPTGPAGAGDDRVLGGTGGRGGPSAAAPAIEAQEQHFLIYAWPIKRGEADRAYFVNENGRVYSASMQAQGYSGDAKPKPDAAFLPNEPLFTGKVGGRGNDGNHWRPVGQEEGVPTGLNVSAEVALILSPHDVKAARATIERLEGTVKLADAKLKTEKMKIEGVEVTKMWYEGETVRDASYHAWLGPTFVLTLGAPKDAIEKIVDKWRRKADEVLDVSPSFAAVKDHVEMDKAEISLYIAAAQITEKVQEQMEEAKRSILPATGLPGVEAVGASLTFEGRGIKDVLYIHSPEPRRGVPRLLSPKPLDQDLVRIVPQEAAFCVVSRFNPTVLWEEIEKLVEAAGPETEIKFRDGVAKFQEQFGLDVPKDLIPTFGDTLIVYREPVPQGPIVLGLLDWTFILKVKDRTKSDGCVETLRRLLAQLATASAQKARAGEPAPEAALQAQWASTPHNGAEVHTLMVPGFAFGQPSYALAKDYLVFGVHPLRVQRALDRLDAKDMGIAEQPDFKQALAKVGPGYGSLCYVDMKRAFGQIRGILSTVAAMAGPNALVDASKLPAVTAIEQHLFGHLTVCRSDSKGISIVGYSPTGSVGALAVAGGSILGAAALPKVFGPR